MRLLRRFTPRNDQTETVVEKELSEWGDLKVGSCNGVMPVVSCSSSSTGF